MQNGNLKKAQKCGTYKHFSSLRDRWDPRINDFEVLLRFWPFNFGGKEAGDRIAIRRRKKGAKTRGRAWFLFRYFLPRERFLCPETLVQRLLPFVGVCSCFLCFLVLGFEGE